ncbi:MAG: DUF3047 domain-containing protein [Thermodesulfobacteriota bacterium]
MKNISIISGVGIKILFISALTLFTLLPAGLLTASPEKVVVSAFSSEDAGKKPSGWNFLFLPRIQRHTYYAVHEEGGRYVLKAVSKRSASGLYREIDLDPSEFRVFSWRWKVEDVIKRGNARIKEGDDFAARVYVTFAYEPEKASLFEKAQYRLLKALYKVPPPGNALNYVWANRLEKGEAVVNPYTSRSIMIAVESGPGSGGVWRREERNVYEDYVKFFHEKPPRISGVVVMTDSDNTGTSATGYYSDIFFKKTL